MKDIEIDAKLKRHKGYWMVFFEKGTIEIDDNTQEELNLTFGEGDD